MRTLIALLLPLPLAAAEITATVGKESIEFHDGEKLITKYHFGEAVAKPYLWPLNAPGGVPVTRAWPMEKGKPGETTDHVHQKSAWFCHGDVIPEGVELKTRSSDTHVKGVDFWSETKGHGRIVCVKVGKPEGTDASVSVATKNEWRTPDGDKILDETRTVTASKTDKGYLITFGIDLHASACGITFGDTKEGAMGVRVPDSFRTSEKDGGTVTSADGTTVGAGTKGTLKVWGEPADWHDYSGKDAGIAIFDHPKNPVRSAWHTRDYGLMAANPFGRDKSGFPSQKGKTELAGIKKGEHLKLNYAIYTHTGDAKAGGVSAAYKLFGESK